MPADDDRSAQQESWFRLFFKHGYGWIAGIAALLTALGIGYGARYVTSPPGPSPSAGQTAQAATSAPQSPAPSVTPGTVLETASNIDLAEGYSISLTGTSLRPYSTDTGEGDLTDSSIGWVSSSAQLAVLDDTPSYAGCAADTRFVSVEGVSPDTNLDGKTVCVTVGDRIAGVAVSADNRASGSTSAYVTIDITVWQAS